LAEKGWIHKFAFQNDALSADTVGREAMQDGYVTGTKIASATIEVANLSATLLKYLLSVGRVDYGHVDYCKVG